MRASPHDSEEARHVQACSTKIQQLAQLSAGFSKHSPSHTCSSLLPSATPNMTPTILQSVNEALCQSPLLYGEEIWGIEGASEEADTIRGSFCDMVLVIPRYAVNGVSEMEMCRESSRAKCSQVLVQG